MQENDETYLVSFGSVYKRAPHPVLGYWPELGEDAVLEVQAKTDSAAREITHRLIGSAWCAIYGPTDPPGWEVLNLGSLEAAVQDPKPTSWTVGVQFTANADGTYELHVEDAADDLAFEGAPPSIVKALSDLTDYNEPEISWVVRG
jgi:hypothetical protein